MGCGSFAVGRAGNGVLPSGAHCGFFLTPLERQGTLACPAGAPFLGKKWGKEPPGEEVPPPGPPSLVGWYGGSCTSHLLPGLRPSHWNAGNGPPTGWAGWGRGWVPFGRRQKVTVWFPSFSCRQQTTSPARPSWWAGHEALVLEAAGQVGRSKNHAASTTVQRKGVWGKETLSPAGSRGTAPGALSPISPEKWGPAREGQVPAVPTAPRKNHNAPQGASLSLR